MKQPKSDPSTFIADRQKYLDHLSANCFTQQLIRDDKEDQAWFYLLLKHVHHCGQIWIGQWCKVNKCYCAGGAWFELDELVAAAPLDLPEIPKTFKHLTNVPNIDEQEYIILKNDQMLVADVPEVIWTEKEFMIDMYHQRLKVIEETETYYRVAVHCSVTHLINYLLANNLAKKA